MGSSWKYHNSHLPTSLYAEATSNSWDRLLPDPAPSPMLVYVASDAPLAPAEYAATEEGVKVFSLTGSARAELREVASPGEYDQKAFDALLLEERVRATNGMVVDLALVSGIWAEEGEVRPEATVCGIR